MTAKPTVAFVVPGHTRKHQFLHSDIGLKLLERHSHFIFYNAGTLQLASIMKHRGHETTLVFDTGDNVSPEKLDADVICISLTTAAATRGYEIADMHRERKVIMGGPHASALPREAAKHADHVVIGEGETVLPKIIDGEITDKIIHAGLLEDVDSSPYLDFSLLPFTPKNFPVLTSRGCPFDCNFCAVTKMFGRKVRMRSPECIMKEIRYYAEKYGDIGRLDLISPNFTIQKKHAVEILERLLAEGLTPELEIRSSTHVLRDKQIPELLSKFPQVSMLIGAESFDEESVNYYRKKRKKDELALLIETMKGYGIDVVASFIWGSKFDTPESMWRLIDRINEVNPSYFHIAMLTPFPGTDLYNEVKNDIFVDDWSYFDLMHVTHYHPRMDPLTMQQTWLEAQKRLWSLGDMIKRRTKIFSPPINKLVLWFLTKFAANQFDDYFEFLGDLEWREPSYVGAPEVKADTTPTSGVQLTA